MAISRSGTHYLYFGYRLYRWDAGQDRFLSLMDTFPEDWLAVGVYQDQQDNICFVFRNKAGQYQAVLEDEAGNRYDYSAFFRDIPLNTLMNVVSTNFQKDIYFCGQGYLHYRGLRKPGLIEQLLPDKYICSVMELPEGQFLVNTIYQGWFVVSPNLSEVKPFVNPLGCNPSPFTSEKSMVQQIIPDDSGGYWWLKPGNLYHYNPQQDECQVYDVAGLRPLPPALFALVGEGLVALTNWSNELFFFDVNQGKEYKPGDAIPYSFPGQVRDLYLARDGTLWIPTDAGLWKINLEENRSILLGQEVGFEGISFLSIYEDEAGMLWLGTMFNGLYRFDPTENRVLQHLTYGDGLAHPSVFSIQPDTEGDLWLGTGNGITILSPEGNIFASIYEPDGLLSNQFYRFDAFRASDGCLFFGNKAGLNVIDPGAVKVKLREDQRERKIYLTSLVYYDPEVEEEVQMPKVSLQAPEIVLPAESRNLKVQFALSSYLNPEKNHFAYRLAGLEQEWQHLGANHELNLFNLPPGQYRLQIKGSDFRGNWTNQVLDIPITAEAFFYKQTWFYVVLFLSVSFIGLAWTLRERHRRKHLEMVVAQRTQKIRRDKDTIESQAARLQELDEAKSRFFANISHEFRTPLTLVMGQIDSVLSALKNPASVDKLKMAHRNASQLQRLINQLLDLSKLEVGKMKLQASCQNIVPLLRHLTNTFESMADQKYIELRFESEQETIMLYYEQDKLEKIMYNLLSNALKFTPPRGHVLVKADAQHEAEDEKGELKITVRDSGVGIPSDRLPQIFDRFYQVDSSYTREFEGTGIGLALTKELVQLHGGGISVESTEGFGTTFTVTLPLGKAHLHAEQMVEAAAALPGFQTLEGLAADPLSAWEAPALDNTVEQIQTDKDIVLIVEDNADMRTFIREGLEKNYSILEAANGEEGFVKAQESIPDLIITDVMMPRVDGYELTHKIRMETVTSHIPIIMLTAKAAEEDRWEGLEKGVDVYLTKPFHKKELQIRVRKLIEMRKQLRRQAGAKAVLSPSEIEASSMDQQFLQRIQEIIEKNIENEDFSVDALALEAGVGRRQLQRKLKALTDSSPQQCIRTMRLSRARQLLEQGAGTVSEICFRVGYGNVNAFARAFREEFGAAPSAIKNEK